MKISGLKTSFFIYSLSLLQIHTLNCDKVGFFLKKRRFLRALASSSRTFSTKNGIGWSRSYQVQNATAQSTSMCRNMHILKVKWAGGLKGDIRALPSCG